MKRLLTIAFLYLVCSTAQAEWVLTSTSQDGSVRSFTDPATYRRTGDIVKVWKLQDFSKPRSVQSKPYLSAKAQIQVNCKEESTRTQIIIAHKENMGLGDVVETTNMPYAEWAPVAPGSLGELDFKWACSYKPK